MHRTRRSRHLSPAGNVAPKDESGLRRSSRSQSAIVRRVPKGDPVGLRDLQTGDCEREIEHDPKSSSVPSETNIVSLRTAGTPCRTRLQTARSSGPPQPRLALVSTRGRLTAARRPREMLLKLLRYWCVHARPECYGPDQHRRGEHGRDSLADVVAHTICASAGTFAGKFARNAEIPMKSRGIGGLPLRHPRRELQSARSAMTRGGVQLPADKIHT